MSFYHFFFSSTLSAARTSTTFSECIGIAWHNRIFQIRAIKYIQNTYQQIQRKRETERKSEKIQFIAFEQKSAVRPFVFIDDIQIHRSMWIESALLCSPTRFAHVETSVIACHSLAVQFTVHTHTERSLTCAEYAFGFLAFSLFLCFSRCQTCRLGHRMDSIHAPHRICLRAHTHQRTHIKWCGNSSEGTHTLSHTTQHIYIVFVFGTYRRRCDVHLCIFLFYVLLLLHLFLSVRRAHTHTQPIR